MIKTKKMKTNKTADFNCIALGESHRLTATIARISGILAICLWAVSASAQTTPFDGMAFQSYLVDSNGAAISGNKSLKFSIFDADSSGNLQWAETQTVTVNAGNFSVILGEGTWDTTAGSNPVSLATVFNGTERYIEIAVDGTPLAPRLRLLPSPYTFHAATAQQIISEDGNNSLLIENNKFVMNKPLSISGGVTVSNGNVTGNITGNVTGNVTGNLTGTVYMSGSKGLRSVTGDYGTVQTTGGGQGTWEGYSIDGRYVFMSDDNDHVGLYNDIDNQWLWDYNRSGDSHKWYNDGAWKMYLSSSDLYLSDGWFGRYNHHTGGLMGSYSNIGDNSEKTNPIYVIGSGYKPLESALKNMYGVGYTHGNASFITGGGSGWGFYVAADGDARTFLSGADKGYSYINKGSKNNSRLGVGTDSPTQTLDVNGHIRIRGGAIVGSGDHYLVIEDYTTQDGVTIRNQSDNNGSIGTASIEWDDGYITELWVEDLTSDRRMKKDIRPVKKNELLEMIDEISFYQYRLRFPREEKMKRQGRDASGFFYGLMAQELREIYPNVVKSSGLAVELDEKEEDEEVLQANRWYVEKDRLAELALGGVKDLYAISKGKDEEIVSLKSQNIALTKKVDVLTAEMDKQEKRIIKLEELMSRIDKSE